METFDLNNKINLDEINSYILELQHKEFISSEKVLDMLNDLHNFLDKMTILYSHEQMSDFMYNVILNNINKIITKNTEKVIFDANQMNIDIPIYET